MVEISTSALIASIQAVAQIISEEEATMDSMEDGPDLYELADSVETMKKALNELKGVYEDARAQGHKLPPYGSIVL